jgi:hypothetical protein
MRYVLVAALLAAGCGGPTPYKPVDTFWRGPYGYTDLAVGSGEHAVTVRANARTSDARVADMLLLRAADVTLAQGRTHFVVLHRDTGDRFENQARMIPVVAAGFVVMVPVGDVVRREKAGHLVVRFCEPGSLPPDAVDAAEIARTLRPKVAPAS